MDIVMPNLDGVSTCQIIRTANPDMKDPPVIAMTSNIRVTDINVYFHAGKYHSSLPLNDLQANNHP